MYVFIKQTIFLKYQKLLPRYFKTLLKTLNNTFKKNKSF